jgi:DNA mismatch repair protein MutS
MTFHSILFEKTEDRIEDETIEAPAFFVDLNLDQIIDAITAGKPDYNLKPFFYASLRDVDAVEYRHEIFRDLENETLFERIGSFAKKMRLMREQLAQADKLYYKYQKESWFLDAVET